MQGNAQDQGPPGSTSRAYTTWRDDERMQLIKSRIQLDSKFTSRNSMEGEAWREVVQNAKLPHEKDIQCCKMQWKNILRKYKALTDSKTGDGAGDSSDGEREFWPFFKIIDEYANKKDNFKPQLLICSQSGITEKKDDMSSTMTAASRSPIRERSPILGRSPMTSRASNSRAPKRSLEATILRENRKATRKMSALVSVFGQIVKADYPFIDVDKLLISSDTESD